jgi:hypothetical protein
MIAVSFQQSAVSKITVRPANRRESATSGYHFVLWSTARNKEKLKADS